MLEGDSEVRHVLWATLSLALGESDQSRRPQAEAASQKVERLAKFTTFLMEFRFVQEAEFAKV